MKTKCTISLHQPVLLHQYPYEMNGLCSWSSHHEIELVLDNRHTSSPSSPPSSPKLSYCDTTWYPYSYCNFRYQSYSCKPETLYSTSIPRAFFVVLKIILNHPISWSIPALLVLFQNSTEILYVPIALYLLILRIIS